MPTPTQGQGGAMWGIFMVFEGTVRPWGWGISQDLLYTLGIGLVPSFLTVISLRGHWCRSLDFNEPALCSFVLTSGFENFSFYFII